MKMIEARRRFDKETNGTPLRRLKTVDFGFMSRKDEVLTRLHKLMDDGFKVLWGGCTEAELRHSRTRWQWLESALSRKGDLSVHCIDP